MVIFSRGMVQMALCFTHTFWGVILRDIYSCHTMGPCEIISIKTRPGHDTVCELENGPLIWANYNDLTATEPWNHG